MATTLDCTILDFSIKCPHCGVSAYNHNYKTTLLPQHNSSIDLSGNKKIFERGKFLLCPVCSKITVFINEKIVYPDFIMVEPSSDMPEEIKKVFLEALSIANKSPRAACALLRLCIDNLVDYLGATKSKKLYEKIKEVAQSPFIEQLLEACRLAGNKAIHPSTIVIDENDIELVKNLAEFINMIVDMTISKPKAAAEIINRFRAK